MRSCSPSLPPEIREGNKGDGFLFRLSLKHLKGKVKEKIRDRPAGFLFRLSLIMNELPLLDLIPKNKGEIQFDPQKYGGG